MELSKKTTILFSPESHQRLSELAERRGVSLGTLVREACATAYGIFDSEARVSATGLLAALHLPVGTTAAMKRESVPSVDAAIP
ncbi:MAG: hypothetical protein ABJB66_01835 [Gemmatimonadaceae bacterium]